MEVVKSKYQWQIEALAKGVDANKAVVELERIQNIYGSLTTENVVRASEDESAVLHPLFTWDNEIAGHKYRLQEARLIINNIQIVSSEDNGYKVVSVYEVNGRNEDNKGVYIHLQQMNHNDIDYIKENIIRSLNSLKKKMETYNRFPLAVKALDKAIGHVKKS